MKDSPAEKAGFKEGDIVISVANNFSNNIQAYKNLLQNVGENVTYYRKAIYRAWRTFPQSKKYFLISLGVSLSTLV